MASILCVPLDPWLIASITCVCVQSIWSLYVYARAHACVCVYVVRCLFSARVSVVPCGCVCVRFVYTSLHLLQQCTDNCRAYIFICVLLRSIVFVCVCVCAMLVYEHLLYVNRATTTPCYRLLRARGLLYSP